jgi:hypothetical protein
MSTTKLDSKAASPLNEPYEQSFDFFKSSEGEVEYKKLGLKYPRTMMDDWYEKFLRLTKNTKKEDHKIYIGNMMRHILANGEEYIIHDMRETKYDPLGNRKTFYRGGIGKYAIPLPRWEIKVNPEEGYAKEKYIAGIDMIETGYPLYTKEH